MRRLCLLFVLATLATGCASRTAVITDNGRPETELLDYGAVPVAKGNVIRVTVYGHPDLSGEFEVDSNGRVTLPLIRQVAAAGLTADELDARLIERLRPDYLVNPVVSVEILDQNPIYVIGEVTSPGQYPYSAGMTIFEAVALAGGFTYRAKTKEASIIRSNDPAKSKRNVTPESTVLPGDVIEIPERLF